jgi:uncharacterized protein (TIGR02594 family)
MKHLEIAYSQEGVAEVAGPGANKSILNFFKQIGRGDIASDEVAWCMAFYLWCLWRAGVDISVIPKEKRLLAISALLLGTRIAEPRVGCGVIIPRRDSSGRIIGHHVFFATGWTETIIYGFGGNQANAVNEREFKRTADMIFMWPFPEETAKDLAAQGSRTISTADRQRKDAAKSGGSELSTHVVPDAPVPDPSAFPPPDVLAAKSSALQTFVSNAESFGLFLWGKWPWIAGAITVYYLARMAWDAGLIRYFRTQDHNTGKIVGAGAEPAPAASSQPQAAAFEEDVSFV